MIVTQVKRKVVVGDHIQITGKVNGTAFDKWVSIGHIYRVESTGRNGDCISVKDNDNDNNSVIPVDYTWIIVEVNKPFSPITIQLNTSDELSEFISAIEGCPRSSKLNQQIQELKQISRQFT